MPAVIGWSYFDNALDPIGRETAIEFARAAQAALDFDTVVVTGVSGVLMGGVIAHALGVNVLVVRKPDDTSTHSYERAEGHLGRRWVALDDFVETGATYRRLKAVVKDIAADHSIRTTHAGLVEYQRGRARNGNGVVIGEDFGLYS